MLASPVLARSQAFLFLEHPVEIGEGLKPIVVGNLRYGFIGGQQLLAHAGQADVFYIIRKGLPVMRLKRSSSFFLPALRAVKKYPGQEVFAEVHEMVFVAGFYKQEVAGLEIAHIAGMVKLTVAADDHIHFIPLVRLLKIDPNGFVHFYRQTAVPEKLGEQMAGGIEFG